MVVRAESHHIFGAVMVLDLSRNNMMVLKDWQATLAATEPSLLAESPLHILRNAHGPDTLTKCSAECHLAHRMHAGETS